MSQRSNSQRKVSIGNTRSIISPRDSRDSVSTPGPSPTPIPSSPAEATAPGNLPLSDFEQGKNMTKKPSLRAIPRPRLVYVPTEKGTVKEAEFDNDSLGAEPRTEDPSATSATESVNSLVRTSRALSRPPLPPTPNSEPAKPKRTSRSASDAPPRTQHMISQSKVSSDSSFELSFILLIFFSLEEALPHDELELSMAMHHFIEDPLENFPLLPIVCQLRLPRIYLASLPPCDLPVGHHLLFPICLQQLHHPTLYPLEFSNVD